MGTREKGPDKVKTTVMILIISVPRCPLVYKNMTASPICQII